MGLQRAVLGTVGHRLDVFYVPWHPAGAGRGHVIHEQS